MKEISISIRNLQHFLYCPHRWGLMAIDCSWAENYFVTKGNLMHNRVHDPGRGYVSRKKRVLTSVPVYHDELNLYGVTDCIELTKDPEGISVGKFPGTYHLTIVEYKPRKPKNKDFNEEDMIQVFAQKICADANFHTRCSGIIYYADRKERQKLPLDENYDIYYKRLTSMLYEMRSFLKSGTIPPIKPHQKCRGCSMINICLPRSRKQQTFDDILKGMHLE